MNDALVRPTSLTALCAALHERGVEVQASPGDDSTLEAVVLRGVEQHSARIDPGDVFVAWKGTAFDAHDAVAEAEQRGAVAAVVEHFVGGVSIPQLRVDNGRLGAALTADTLYGSPWQSMHVTAITGTNGKTTTAQLVRWAMEDWGPAASVGTLGLTEANGRVRDGTESLTTPGPTTVSRWLAELRAAGVDSVVMEASSHALAQQRLDGLRCDAAVFTNVTQDHLDYHDTFDAYVGAKRRLTDLLKPNGVVVCWQDDPAWAGLEGPGGTVTYSAARSADLRATDIRATVRGTRFVVEYEGDRQEFDVPLVGAFNVENALAAGAVALSRGASLAAVSERLGAAPQIAGRLEGVLDAPFRVLIDYAHTPDALERVLRTLKPLSRGRLIVVFGAGGDRDTTKRPLMGAAAAQHADHVVITSDNPRSEDPEAIIDEIVPGLGDAPYTRIADRRSAVIHALSIAQPDDVVLLAGKGHERYQVLADRTIDLDEREIVHEWVEASA